MLPARAAEREHEVGEAALQIAAHVGIGEAIHAVEKYENFPIVFKELNHRLVAAREFFVRLVSPGVVRAAAVEHVAAAVAAFVLRNAFFITETEHAHHEVLMLFQPLSAGLFARLPRRVELRQIHKFLQRLLQIRVGGAHAVEQLAAQALNGTGNAVEEIFFALKVTAQAVCTEHLQHAEQYEERQSAAKLRAVHARNLCQFVQIVLNQCLAQRLRIACRGLPKERSHVVLQRPLHATLKVDEPRLSVGREHHVACLKVAIQKARVSLAARHEVGRQFPEILFKEQFVVRQVGGFEEAIFEIMEVEERSLRVEPAGREAAREVQPLRACHLYVGQQAERAPDERNLFFGILRPGGASLFQRLIERAAAKVLLEIAHAVVAHGVNFGKGQTLAAEMPGKVDKLPVLFLRLSHHADHRAVAAGKAHIDAVAARLGERLGFQRRSAEVLLV